MNVEILAAFLYLGLQDPFECLATLLEHAHGRNVRCQYRRIQFSQCKRGKCVVGHLLQRRGRDSLTPNIVFPANSRSRPDDPASRSEA